VELFTPVVIGDGARIIGKGDYVIRLKASPFNTGKVDAFLVMAKLFILIPSTLP